MLDATGVDTGHARRDRDLRAPRLLAVEQMPTWLFVSEGVEPDAAGWRVTGRLTVRRPCTVVLDVAPPEPLADGSLRVRATTSLDRRDAGRARAAGARRTAGRGRARRRSCAP